MARNFFVSALAILYALMFSSQASAQEVTANFGVSSSINLGESIGFHAGLRTDKEASWFAIENTTFFDSSQKSSGGWKVGEKVVARFGKDFGVLAGADFRYRDGGPWAKKTVWAISGISQRIHEVDLRFLGRYPVYESHPNHVHALQGEVDVPFRSGSKFGVLYEIGVVRFNDLTEGAPNRYALFQTVSLTVKLHTEDKK